MEGLKRLEIHNNRGKCEFNFNSPLTLAVDELLLNDPTMTYEELIKLLNCFPKLKKLTLIDPYEVIQTVNPNKDPDKYTVSVDENLKLDKDLKDLEEFHLGFANFEKHQNKFRWGAFFPLINDLKIKKLILTSDSLSTTYFMFFQARVSLPELETATWQFMSNETNKHTNVQELFFRLICPKLKNVTFMEKLHPSSSSDGKELKTRYFEHGLSNVVVSYTRLGNDINLALKGSVSSFSDTTSTSYPISGTSYRYSTFPQHGNAFYLPSIFNSDTNTVEDETPGKSLPARELIEGIPVSEYRLGMYIYDRKNYALKKLEPNENLPVNTSAKTPCPINQSYPARLPLRQVKKGKLYPLPGHSLDDKIYETCCVTSLGEKIQDFEVVGPDEKTKLHYIQFNNDTEQVVIQYRLVSALVNYEKPRKEKQNLSKKRSKKVGCKDCL